MNGFVIAPLHNKPGRHDATGAFHLGARRFAALHGLPNPVFFENEGSAESVARGFLNHIDAAQGGWDVFAYFGHGDSNALGSAHVAKRYGAKVLADKIRPKATNGIVILLYACNTGKEDGFASWLADELSDLNPWVYAHVPPPGHTFTNANVVYYPGGNWVIEKGHRLWRDWYHDMHSEKNDLWARFPFMTQDEIEAELEAPEFLLGRWSLKPGGYDVVFFGDKWAARLHPGSRYGVAAWGKWTATKHRLSVMWNGGDDETWPLPLSLTRQNVRYSNFFTGAENHKADRTESAEQNPGGFFHTQVAPVKTKQSKLIDI